MPAILIQRATSLFRTATGFEQCRALVSRDGKYSVIDTQGKTIAEIPYRVLGDYSAGLAVVQHPRSGTTATLIPMAKSSSSPVSCPPGKYN